jgi:hypothetical protein
MQSLTRAIITSSTSDGAATTRVDTHSTLYRAFQKPLMMINDDDF